MARQHSGIRPWLIASAGLVCLALILMAALWLFRQSMAEIAVRNWCRSNDFDCRLDVTTLGLSHLEVENLVISNEAGETPLEFGEARIDWKWPGFGPPAVSDVKIDRPVIRASYAPERDVPLKLGGLESLSGGGGQDQALPEISLNDITIELDTPAGPVVAKGRFSGQLPYQGELTADISPADLTSGANRLVVEEGHVDLRFAGLTVDGDARLNVPQVEFEGVSARDVRLAASMSGTLFSEIEWSAGIGQLGYGDIGVTEADLSGQLHPRTAQPENADPGLLGHLQSGAMSGSVQSLQIAALTAGPGDVSLDLARTGPDTLEGTFALRSEEVVRNDARAGKATLSGTLSTANSLSRLSASADVVLEDASVTGDFREQLISSITTGPPLDAHAAALRAWLGEVLQDFSFGTGLRARYTDASDWSLTSTRALSFRAANGTHLGLAPQETQPAANLSPEGAELSGLLNLSGGGAPDFAAMLRSVRLPRDARPVIELGGVSLAPWTAGGLTLAGDLDEVSLTYQTDAPRLKTVGTVRIDGPLYGMRLDDTRLFGGIDAIFDAGGIRVQTYQTRCLGLDSAGLSFNAGYGIGDTSLQLCPVNGRVVRQTNGIASGQVELGNLSLPFTAPDSSGTLSLEGASLDWQAGANARLSVTASALRLPLDIGDEKLTVASTSPRLSLQSGRPAALSAEVARTEFSGSVIPASLSLSQATFQADLAASGLEGQAKATGVELRDAGEDPLFEPLTGDLAADFSGGIMTLSGPITVPRASGPVANAQMKLDLDTLDGTAQITSQTLQFSPGGLQPTALSERVRGFLSNARGELKAEASFEIEGGQPSGTGWVSVSDFGFDTLRVGAVSGVEGRLTFNDILSLTTPPGQEVRIGQINPGIPLENGRISFQLVGGRQAIIEEARWPFAGGELIVGESEWTVAGTSDTIRIQASALELSRIVEIFSLPDIDATGTVSGEFPVEIDGPNAYVRNATLKADETGGKVAYTGDIADAASQADERVRMAFNALRDFRFSVLELGANGNLSGDMMVTLKLIGRSPEVLDGAPFAFNIGVDSKLMQLIQTGRSVTTSDWLVDAVRESASGGASENETQDEQQAEDGAESE